MGNRFYVIVIAAAAGLLLLWNSIFIVNEREQAVVLRFGQIQRVVDEAGLNFKLPFGFAGADKVQKLPDRLLRFDLEDIRVQVSGGKFYEVDAFLVYNIADAALFLQTVSGSVPLAEQRLRTRLDAALRRAYGQRGFEAALSEERAEMMLQVRDQIRPEAASLGIELTDVRIRRTDLTDEVSQQTFERMQAERLAEAERLRARGQVAARQIRAAADREVVETVAAARREAEILQGQGEAQRNAIFAEAFGADPEFFEFYRSMNAYEEALINTGTTMVLSPDSEFFRYFESDGGGTRSVVSNRPAGQPAAGAPAEGAAGPDAPATPEAALETPAEVPEAADAAQAAQAAGTAPGAAEPAAAAAPTEATDASEAAGTVTIEVPLEPVDAAQRSVSDLDEAPLTPPAAGASQ